MQYSAAQLKRIHHARKQIQEVDTDTNFLQLPKTLLGVGLNSDQIIVLSYAYETIQMSWNNGDDFYDGKRHAYYVVINREKMAHMINTTPNTVGTVIQELCDIGYISKVQSWNKGLKIFVRHFSKGKENKKSELSRVKNSESNETQQQYTQSTVDTQHTSASNLNIDDKINVGIQKALKSIFGNKHMSGSSEKQMDDKKDDEHINYAVNGTKSLPEGAVNRIDKMATNLYGNDKRAKGKFIYGINGLIYRTKSQVAKKNDLYSYFRWENTPELAKSFSANIYEMLYGAYSGTRSFKCPKDAYFVGSLKKFFNKFVRKALHKPSKSEKKPQRKHIHEKIPYWAKSDYQPDESGISDDYKRKLKSKLNNIKA